MKRKIIQSLVENFILESSKWNEFWILKMSWKAKNIRHVSVNLTENTEVYRKADTEVNYG